MRACSPVRRMHPLLGVLAAVLINAVSVDVAAAQKTHRAGYWHQRLPKCGGPHTTHPGCGSHRRKLHAKGRVQCRSAFRPRLAPPTCAARCGIFPRAALDADVSVVYFSGIGVDIDGTNYLVPADAVLERDQDAFDESVPLDRVLQAVEPAKRLRLIIIDASHDNPFQRRMKRTSAGRTSTTGLAALKPPKPNTVIAIRRQGRNVSSQEGTGTNSPYAASLLKHLATPGLDLRKSTGVPVTRGRLEGNRRHAGADVL